MRVVGGLLCAPKSYLLGVCSGGSLCLCELVFLGSRKPDVNGEGPLGVFQVRVSAAPRVCRVISSDAGQFKN